MTGGLQLRVAGWRGDLITLRSNCSSTSWIQYNYVKPSLWKHGHVPTGIVPLEGGGSVVLFVVLPFSGGSVLPLAKARLHTQPGVPRTTQPSTQGSGSEWEGCIGSWIRTPSRTYSSGGPQKTTMAWPIRFGGSTPQADGFRKLSHWDRARLLLGTSGYIIDGTCQKSELCLQPSAQLPIAAAQIPLGDCPWAAIVLVPICCFRL